MKKHNANNCEFFICRTFITLDFTYLIFELLFNETLIDYSVYYVITKITQENYSYLQ